MPDSFMKDHEELSADEDYMDFVQREEDDDFVEAAFKYNNDLDGVTKLQTTRRFNDIIQKIEDTVGVNLEEDDLQLEYHHELIVECNSLLVDIDNEIVIIHNLIRDNYRSKFPDLESLLPHPIDYARVVKKIGNETLVDLQGLVPPAIILAVSLTASTSGTPPLPQQLLQKTIDACDRILRLDATKKKMLDFIERRMRYIAPNLSGIVGSGVAAKLMGAAGGLSTLASMPACNVQLLGAKRRTPLAGFSSASINRVGYLEETEIFQGMPPSLRMRVCRVLAAKSALASRVDCMKADPTGKTGRCMRDEILNKIEKWQEPPPARHPRPLPVPDSEPRKKRGGHRLRKTKERYGMTEMRKSANRMPFGVAEESSLGDGYGQGYGMLGKLRLPAVGPSKLGVKVANKFKKKPHYGHGATTSGYTSSLAFTPLQGIELSIPRPLETGTRSIYFSETSAFSKMYTT